MIQVFSNDWFEKHQKRLLKLLNNRLVQAYLDIPKEKYIKVTQGALVHRQGKQNVLKAKSYPYIADKLYKKFKPIWYLVHFWDWSTQWKPEWNFGFDTLTEYPNTTTYVDYTVRRARTYSTQQTWADIIAGSGTSYTESTHANIKIETGDSSNRYIEVSRYVMPFDTSAIGTEDTITDTDLQIDTASSPDRNDFGGFAEIKVVGWNVPDASIVRTASYQNVGSTAFGLFDNFDFVSDTTTSANLSTSSVTKGDTTGLALVHEWDYDGTFGGTWSIYEEAVFSVYTSLYSGGSKAPELTVVYTPNHLASFSGTMQVQEDVNATAQRNASFSGDMIVETQFNAGQQEAQGIEKTFIYRVYDKDGNYKGQWSDVIDDPNWTQRINTAGAPLQVRLARSPLNKKTTYSMLVDDTNDSLTDDGSDPYIVPDETTFTVGDGTDVDVGLFVDVYVFYGSLEQWVDDGNDPITDDTGDPYLLGVGSPAGKKIYSGKIDTYNLVYGIDGGVEVSLVSTGADLSQRVIKSGSNTDVTYTSQDPSDIAKDILDNYGGDMTYTNATIDSTSTTVTYTFKLNTALEGMNKVVQLAPEDWYWYGDVGTGEIHLHEKGTTANHIFKLGAEISRFELRETIRNLVNEVYFVGGDTGGGTYLYKTYSNATSQTNYGNALEIVVDHRVTDATTAGLIANGIINDKKDPEYTSTLVIPDIVYDIYSINLGEMVGFAGFGNFVDDLILQITEISYSRNEVKLTLGSNLEEQRKRIEDLERNIKDEGAENIGTAPS